MDERKFEQVLASTLGKVQALEYVLHAAVVMLAEDPQQKAKILAMLRHAANTAGGRLDQADPAAGAAFDQTMGHFFNMLDAS